MSTIAIRVLALALLASISTIGFCDTYTTIDFPGAVTTDLSGINAAGVMVGTYTDAAGASHGFRLDDEGFQTIDYPAAVSTLAFSVNARGDVAGFFLDAANHWHGFLVSGGDFFAQDYPGATTGSFTLGIGEQGTLVGEFKVGQSFGQLGFAWILRDGQYAQILPPDCSGQTPSNPVQAFATSVNARGDVVGRLVDAAGRQCAWKLDERGFAIAQFPGASITNARGINASGEAVGVYRLSGVNHGFVLPPDDLTDFTSIDFPGAASTRALGISARGDIVGTYALAGPLGTGHGFLLERDHR